MGFPLGTVQCERIKLSITSTTTLHASALPPPAMGRFGHSTVNQRYSARTVAVASNAGRALFSSFDASSGGKVGRAEYTEESTDSVRLLLPEQSAAPANSSGAPRMPEGAARSRSTPEERALVLLEVKDFLSNELQSMWATGVSPLNWSEMFCEKLQCRFSLILSRAGMVQVVTASRYATDVTFIDPILELTSREAYIWNVEALRAAFDVTYTLLSIESNAPSEIITRWACTHPCPCVVLLGCLITAHNLDARVKYKCFDVVWCYHFHRVSVVTVTNNTFCKLGVVVWYVVSDCCLSCKALHTRWSTEEWLIGVILGVRFAVPEITLLKPHARLYQESLCADSAILGTDSLWCCVQSSCPGSRESRSPGAHSIQWIL